MALHDLPEGLAPPQDDGAADHLTGMRLADIPLPATTGAIISPGALKGRVVLYAYPMTGRPDRPLPENWDAIPGARGCTPQSCAFRDHLGELEAAGIDAVFGLSTQRTAYQLEAAKRLHLPFPLLSDANLAFQQAMGLPTMVVPVEGEKDILLKRLTLIARDGVIEKIFYPVFPPNENASEVLAYLRGQSGL